MLNRVYLVCLYRCIFPDLLHLHCFFSYGIRDEISVVLVGKARAPSPLRAYAREDKQTRRWRGIPLNLFSLVSFKSKKTKLCTYDPKSLI